MVEDLIEEMFRSAETGRVITNEPWSSMQSQRKLTRPLPEVEGEVCQKKDLTGPTLLEMSGYRVNQELGSDCRAHFVVDSAAGPPRSFRFSAPPVNSISSIAPSTAD